jgi:hypothetical protein
VESLWLIWCALSSACVGCKQQPELEAVRAEPSSSAAVLSLPDVEAPPQDIDGALEVRVSERSLRVGGVEVLRLPPLAEQSSAGVGREAKRKELYVPALEDSLKRAGPAKSNVVLFIDRKTPFRPIVEIVFTLGQAGVERLVFATSLPEAKGPGAGFKLDASVRGKSGAFNVFVVEAGFSVKDRGRNVAPGCGGRGDGLAVPRSSGGYDFPALTRCLRSLRQAPRDPSDTSDDAHGFVLSGPGTRYDDLLRTIAALHTAGVTSFAFKVPK